jgi:hypothetical protein
MHLLVELSDSVVLSSCHQVAADQGLDLFMGVHGVEVTESSTNKQHTLWPLYVCMYIYIYISYIIPKIISMHPHSLSLSLAPPPPLSGNLAICRSELSHPRTLTILCFRTLTLLVLAGHTSRQERKSLPSQTPLCTCERIPLSPRHAPTRPLGWGWRGRREQCLCEERGREGGRERE